MNGRNNTAKWMEMISVLFVIALVAVTRLVPHPWNFTPVGAVAVFGGLYLTRRMAFIVPLAAMLVADLCIGFSWPDVPFVYGSLAIAVALGIWMQKDYNRISRFIPKVLGGALLSSFIFYLITNFGSWISLPEYTKDWQGLMLSYTMAIPFFKYTLAGDLFYLAGSIGIYELVIRYVLKSALIKTETK